MRLVATTSISLGGPLFSPDTAKLAQAGIMRHVTAGLEALKTEVSYAMVRGNPTVFNIGNLVNSLTTSTPKIGNVIEGVLGTTKIYAPVMEFGRRPGAPGPPIKPIELWVKRVLKPKKKDLAGLTFVVRRSIHEKGIEAKAPFARGQAAATPRIESELNAAAAEFARTWGGGVQ